MSCEAMPILNPQRRGRTTRSFNILFFVYLAFSFVLIFSRPTRNSPEAWAIDLATGVSLIAMLVVAAVGLARQRDEFQRKLLTEAIVWGTGGMLAVTSIWGLLEVHTSIPRMDILFNFPIFLLITVVAKIAIFRRIPVSEE